MDAYIQFRISISLATELKNKRQLILLSTKTTTIRLSEGARIIYSVIYFNAPSLRYGKRIYVHQTECQEILQLKMFSAHSFQVSSIKRAIDVKALCENVVHFFVVVFVEITIFPYTCFHVKCLNMYGTRFMSALASTQIPYIQKVNMYKHRIQQDSKRYSIKLKHLAFHALQFFGDSSLPCNFKLNA